MDKLAVFRQPETQRLIRPRLIREEALLSTKNWGEINHIAARLLAYGKAADALMRARDIWPELFDSFRVEYLESSRPILQPLKSKPWTSERIIGGLSPLQPVRDELRASGQILKAAGIDVDGGIAEKWIEGLDPVVHAEMLLFDWLEKGEGSTRADRFFKGYKFIGTSKPPCRLCHFFFEEHGTDIQVRPSHRNLYLAWRMPDVQLSQGSEAIVRRRTIIQGIKQRVCADIIQTMKDRFADRTLHDSTSSSAFTRALGTGSLGVGSLAARSLAVGDLVTGNLGAGISSLQLGFGSDTMANPFPTTPAALAVKRQGSWAAEVDGDGVDEVDEDEVDGQGVNVERMNEEEIDEEEMDEEQMNGEDMDGEESDGEDVVVFKGRGRKDRRPSGN